MIVDKKIAKLVCELEYRIGRHTYNPNSYNGWTGESGCGYRYPIYYCKNKEDFENRELTKDYIIIRELDPEYIQTMKYKFGSNHLYIGDGIVDALKFLEEKYDINFNELEQKKIDKRKQELAKINKKLENGETVIIDSGQKIVGIDIPVGKFKIETTSEGSDIYMVICDEDEKNTEYVDLEDTKQMIYTFKEGYHIKIYDEYAFTAVVFK